MKDLKQTVAEFHAWLALCAALPLTEREIGEKIRAQFAASGLPAFATGLEAACIAHVRRLRDGQPPHIDFAVIEELRKTAEAARQN